MHAQEIFDKVATHLFTQGAWAYDSTEGACAYRSGTNKFRCAVGCMIPDYLYRRGMEGQGFNADFITDWKLPKYFSDNRDMLSELQIIHDNLYNWECTKIMKDKLEYCAYHNNVKPDILDTLSFKGK